MPAPWNCRRSQEPISAIGRLRGVRTTYEAPVPTSGVLVSPAVTAKPDWRLALAAAVDAAVVGLLLLGLIAIARLATRAPIATQGTSGALSFALMGTILALSYFAWFAVSGETAGTKALGLGRTSCGPSPMTLQALARRALHCATDDLRFVAASGAWLGSTFRPREEAPARAECRAMVND